MSDRARRFTAEFTGTAFLLAAVVGSGIMAERLTDDVALQLLANSFATVGVLTALILALGPHPAPTSTPPSPSPTESSGASTPRPPSATSSPRSRAGSSA